MEAKLAALRAKTDLDLFCILSRELDAALAIAGRDPAGARRARDQAVQLLPGMRALTQEQKWALSRKIAAVSERAGAVPGVRSHSVTAAPRACCARM